MSLFPEWYIQKASVVFARTVGNSAASEAIDYFTQGLVHILSKVESPKISDANQQARIYGASLTVAAGLAENDGEMQKAFIFRRAESVIMNQLNNGDNPFE